MNKISMPWEKRLFDIVFSILIAIILSPFIVLITAGIILEGLFIPSSRGSVFYSETRISQGEPFEIYKFRIFKRQALARELAQNGRIETKQLEKRGANLTFVGKTIKHVYLDELPQIYNVLRGDLSLVGPRPTNLVNFKRGIARGNKSKYLIKAGITGFFQSHKSQKYTRTQEEIDMEYARLCQDSSGWEVVLYDIKIILMTVKTIIKAEGI